jgi:5-methyltetrahydrofolate corrinoid/iron sulfur protein methyltransferase
MTDLLVNFPRERGNQSGEGLMRIVADNLQILDPRVSRAVEHLAAQPIVDLVRQYVAAGAEAIDINAGPLPRAAERRMRFLVEAVQSATPLPLLLDTANPAALAAGLDVCRNRAILNGFSLQPERLERVLPLAVAREVEVVGYLLRPDGLVPAEADEKLALAVELHAAATRAGLPQERLIIDPVVAPLAWENGLAQNRANLEVIRFLPEVLGYPVRTMAGLSNLTSGPEPAERKQRMEQAFLPMLAAAGLDFLLVNVLHAETVRVARAARRLLQEAVFAWGPADI